MYVCVCKYFFQQKRLNSTSFYIILNLSMQIKQISVLNICIFIQNVYNNILRLVMIHYVGLCNILLINLDFSYYSFQVKKKLI